MHHEKLETVLTMASRALAAGASVVNGAATPGGPRPNDAKLLALERVYAEHEAEWARRRPDVEDTDALNDDIVGRQHAIMEAMAAVPADTLAGSAAKARVTARHRRDMLRDDTPSALQADALDDLVAWCGRMAGP